MEGTVTETRMVVQSEENGSSSSTRFVLQRKKIEFEPARKQFGGFGSGSGSGGFRIETLNPDAGRKRPAPGSDTCHTGGKRLEASEGGESGLDPELYMGITFRRIGAGLQNLGNTCFLNSVLQCLTYTEPLAAYLQSGKHQNSCHVAGFCALCAIQKHVSRALQSTGRSLYPKDLVANLRCISRNFRNARQEDAHEYMVNLLESMHKCCLPSGVPSESPAAYEKSLVHKIFGGHLRSQVECQQCLYCSNKFDPFLDLSLEIVKADTLPTALRNFTAAEMLDGGEKHYQCQRCKQKVKAKKRLTVHKAPYVLTIHLKRFQALDPTRKFDKRVLYDRSLDMKPFVSGSYDGDLKYSLYGVLVHYGHNTHSGHYVCFVRTSSGMWYLLNDNEVRQVAEKTVLEQKAYMLFYVRDRKNITSRKSIDVVRKDNMGATASANIANLVLKQISKERVDNDLIGKSHVADTSVRQNDRLKSGISQESTQKEASLPQGNGVIVQGCSVPRAEPTLCTPLLKDSSKGVPALNSDQGDCSEAPAESTNSKVETPRIENGTITTGSTPDVSIKVSTSGCDPQSGTASEPVTNGISQKINLVLNERLSSSICSGDSDKIVQNIPRPFPSFDEKTSDVIELQRKPNGPGSASTQGGVMIPIDISGNSPSDQAGVSVKENMDELSKSASSNMSSEPPENGTDLIVHSKSKKKLSRGRVPRVHLGLKFFKVFLRLQKKKHKKGKRRGMDGPDLIKDQLIGNLELGPSTSMKYMTISLASNSRRKVPKSSSKKRGAVRKCQNDSSMVIVDGENTGRDVQNVDEHSTNKQLHKSCTISQVNQQDASNLSRAENSKRDASDAYMAKMIADSVGETTIARWDGIEMPTTSSAFNSNRPERTNIGYLPDEWDQEYDRGKRKKLRQFKHTFGRPNPFQEIATKRLHFKKLQKDRSSSGNRPFRI